ncbi:MAG: hypothetical protein IJZ47_04330 [Oscillospiraceae bacterium]|nr:hypothetical protein [Oscillospiraceae bacterium]
MATITSMAMQQLNYAELSTRYSSQINYANTQQNKYDITKKDQSYDEFWENITKDKDGYIKKQYEALYNSMFGTAEKDTAEKAVSLKGAAFNVIGSAEALNSFAEGLKYGGEYDADAAKKNIEAFVKDYNTFIDKVGDSENSSVLEKGVMLVNAAKVHSGSLGRVGISIGNDNKLTFDPEYMSEISATDLKTSFGDFGITDKVAQKAEQINRLTGSAGAFAYTGASTQNYAYTMGALFSTYA